MKPPIKPADPWEAAYHRLGISTPTIIVRRDDMLRDEAVFTGQLMLAAASDRKILDVEDYIIGLGSWSPHIEQAFVFPDPLQAHRWRSRLAIDDGAQIAGAMIWVRTVVRLDGDFHPGEVVRRFISQPELPRAAFDYARHLEEFTREPPL